MRNRKKRKLLSAQTATELAAFGVILLFMLGLLIRYASHSNNVQNHWMKATRLALTKSFHSSWQLDSSGKAENSSRIMASVLVIEDRKDVDVTGSSGKYGPEARSAYVFGGGGSMTNKLMMPAEFGKDDEVPVMDLYVNGEHFPLSVAAYRIYCFADDEGQCTEHPDSVFVPDSMEAGECAGFDCPVFYTKIPGPAGVSADWDSNDTERFDYNRNGATGETIHYGGFIYRDGDVMYPNRMAWQWRKVPGLTENFLIEEGATLSYDVDGDLKEEKVFGLEDTNQAQFNTTAPWQYSSSPSSIYGCEGSGIVKYAWVLDMQEGDYDQTYNTYDYVGGPTPAEPGGTDQKKPGLMDETRIYTETRDGTLLRIEEGKLVAAGGQVVRNTRMTDRLSLIERKFQLSNDTGRLCGNGTGKSWDVGEGVPNYKVNPYVESCNDCLSDANMFKNCFDEEQKVFYIRSRIEDRGGHRWTVDVSDDQMPIQ